MLLKVKGRSVANLKKMAVTTGTAASASASFGLAITEKWIRERLNLHKDSLDDVRSLSLPGSYCEKITHLGRSLMGFTCLKHLDLSRNALESLDGLQDLKRLETLNLYYNNIPSLKELFKLGHNSKLKDLDLRLNPVTKNEPDYRLFVVHMLVNLRKLDDRAVRDTERKAALMHFDTEQANMFDERLRQPETRSEEGLKDPHSHVSARLGLVKSLASRPTALEDDSDYLLDLIAKSDHLLSPSSRHHHAPCHASSSSRSLDDPSPSHHHHHHHHRHHHDNHRHHHDNRSHATPSRSHQVKVQSRPSTRQFSPPERQVLDLSDQSSEGGMGRYCTASEEPRPRVAGLTPVRGNFAPAPVVSRSSQEEEFPMASSHFALRQLLRLLQDHVDGNLMSLERDSTFQDQFASWYSNHTHFSSREGGGGVVREETVESLQGEVDALQTELRTMEGHLRERDKGQEAKQSKIKELEDLLSLMKSESAELTRKLQAQVAKAEELGKSHLVAEESQQRLLQARADMSSLKQRVHSLEEDNRSLREALGRTPSTSQLEMAHKQIGELQAENNALKREMEGSFAKHKEDLLNTSQLQELVTMLQESHRSLVATNDHLLQELDEVRQKHSHEVMQMNLNYEQLRKTVQHANKLL